MSGINTSNYFSNFQSYLIPSESKLVQEALLEATEAANKSFLEGRMVSTAYAIAAITLSLFNTINYLALGTFRLLNNIIVCNFSDGFVEAGAGLRDSFLSLIFSISEVVFVIIGIFCPTIVYDFLGSKSNVQELNHQHDQQVQEFQNQLQQKEQQRSQLENELSSLRNQITELNSEHERQIQELQTQLQQKEQVSAQLSAQQQNELSSLKDQISELNRQHDQQVQRLQTQLQQKEQVSAQLSVRQQDELSSLRGQVEQLNRQHVQQIQELQTQQQQKEQVSAQLSAQQQNELSSLKDQISELNRQHDQQVQRLQTQLQQKEQMSAQLSARQQDELSSLRGQVEQLNRQHVQQVQRLQTQLQQSEQKREEVVTSLKSQIYQLENDNMYLDKHLQIERARSQHQERELADKERNYESSLSSKAVTYIRVVEETPPPTSNSDLDFVPLNAGVCNSDRALDPFIQRGRRLFEKAQAGTLEEIPIEQRKECMVDLIWYLMDLAKKNGEQFKEGTFYVSDPEYRLFNFFLKCPVTYSRPSTHYAGRIKEAPFGIDTEDLQNGLPNGKRTVNFSAVEHRLVTNHEFTFFKPENWGMGTVIATLNHAADYIATRPAHLLGDPNAQGDHKEHLPKNVEKKFLSLQQLLTSKQEIPSVVKSYGIAGILSYLSTYLNANPTENSEIFSSIQTLVEEIELYGDYPYLRKGQEVIIFHTKPEETPEQLSYLQLKNLVSSKCPCKGEPNP